MTRITRIALALLAAAVAATSVPGPARSRTVTPKSATTATEKLQPDQKRVTVYRCAVGDRETAKPGVCPVHKTALKKTSVVRTWKCGSCGMSFNHSGVCSMDNTPLAAYDVNFLCPADGKPVKHGGMCTRCDMTAKEAMVKAPVAVASKGPVKK